MPLRSIPGASPIFDALPGHAGFYMLTPRGWRTGCFVSLDCLGDVEGTHLDQTTLREHFEEWRDRIERTASDIYDVGERPALVTRAALGL